MVSILTNQSAQVALQTMRNVSSNLQETQNRISTGLEVRSAKDNAAYFLVAQTVRGDLAVLEGLRDNLTLSVNAAKTATNGINAIADNLNEIQQALTTADTGQALEELQFAINNLVEEVEGTINATSFNGVNLLSGTGTQTVTTSIVRDGGDFQINTFTLRSQDLDNIVEDASLDVLYRTYSPDAADRFDVDGNGSVDFTSAADSSFFSRTVREALDTDASGTIDAPDFAVNFDIDGDLTDDALQLSPEAVAQGAVAQFEALGITFFDRDAGIIEDAGASQFAGVTNRNILDAVVAEAAAANTFMIDADEAFRQQLEDNGIVFKFDAAVTTGVEAVQRFSIDLTANSSVIDPTSGTAFTNRELLERTIDSSFLRGAAEASGFSAVLRKVQVNGPDGNVQAGLVLAESLISRVNVNSSTLGTFERTLESRQNFLENLTDSLETGVSSLVEADLDEESTRLQALQTQEQLAIQALTIANSRPQNILSLFR